MQTRWLILPAIGLLLLLSSAQGRRPVQAASSAASWSPMQAIGPPDTATAGDAATAWATLAPDGGLEWLEVDFDRKVMVAMVRVRESFNPGAVTRIAAIRGGEETELWSGQDPTKKAPGDLVIKPSSVVNASRIRVYLDTRRIAGWNEIDAVELIGTDGSRQWAIAARASSSYADAGGNQGDPLAALLGRKVKIQLASGAVSGRIERIVGAFIELRAAGKRLLVAREAIELVEIRD